MSSQHDLMLANDMAHFYDDPLGFVLYAFDWSDPALQVCKLESPWREIYGSEYGPDVWACEILTAVGHEVRKRSFDGVHPVPPIYVAVASGHGIGKSALTAWLVLWIMSTRPFARGTITAVTAPQLASKTWPELMKWANRSITKHWFEFTSSPQSMVMRHRQHAKTWMCSALTCKEENAEAFAGQHSADSTSFYIFDEASGIPDKIYEVARGGLTDGEPMFFAFGNPTRNTGWFADFFRNPPEGAILKQIDSRTVQITNKAYLNSLVNEYGENSDYVKVRVKGQFPSASSKQLIPYDVVKAATGRHLKPPQYENAPVILGVDPAWEGDDEFVIAMRQGPYSRILFTADKQRDDMHMARIIARYEDELKAAAVFVDGGFGTGIISAGRYFGRTWRLVWFSSKSPDPAYLNLRAYMWGMMANWLSEGGAIPEDSVLIEELCAPEMIIRPDGKFQLESKDSMKRRGMRSPNRADALALTFAAPVRIGPSSDFTSTEQYDPHAKL